MAKTYKASISVACLKEHTCVGCGGKFAYVFKREVKGEAANEAQSVLNAQQAADKATLTEVDQHPCPHCGLMQPEMIAHERSTRFWVGAAVAVVGVAVALILGLTHVITIATSAYIATGTMSLAFLWNMLACFYNPNKDLEGNRMRSKAQLTQKPQDRWEEHGQAVGGLTFGSWLGLMFLLVAVLMAIVPVMMAGINGWVQNPGCYPAVCGPGDKPCIYFNEKITSVKSYWHGSVNVKIANAGGLGIGQTPINGETKNSQWGNTISGKNVSNNTHRMWAKLLLPDDKSWVGKTLKLNLQVAATFPVKVGNGFNDERQTFHQQTELTLSAPKSGQTYKNSWWIGQVVILVLIIAATSVLVGTCNALKTQGQPTSVSPLEEEEYEEEEAD